MVLPESTTRPVGRFSSAPPGTVAAGLGVFALYSLALGLFMAIAPHSFFKVIGPFGTVNSHYIRDLSTYNLAIGAALAISIRRLSWRIPALALTTIQFVLHSVNHLVDIGKAHPAWTGVFDFVTLAISAVLLAWLWRVASAEERSR